MVIHVPTFAPIFLLPGFYYICFALKVIPRFMFLLDGSSAGDQGNGQDGSLKQYQNLITPLLFIGFVLSSIVHNAREQKQLSLSFLCVLKDHSSGHYSHSSI